MSTFVIVLLIVGHFLVGLVSAACSYRDDVTKGICAPPTSSISTGCAIFFFLGYLNLFYFVGRTLVYIFDNITFIRGRNR